MMKRWILLSISATVLLAGAVDYGLFRQDTYVGSVVAQLLHIREIRDICCYGLLAWYLPDYLWMLALSLTFFAVIAPQNKHLGIWAAILALYGSGWELVQHLGVVSGTADWLDVIAYIMAVCTAVMINLLLMRREKT